MSFIDKERVKKEKQKKQAEKNLALQS